MSEPAVTIVGAGVIGLSIALEAQARGLRLRVIDREGPAAGASAGNAGAFAFSEILPLASPKIIRQAPKWLFDPLGPLAIRPSYALRVAPWMLRFWRASRPSRVAASIKAQAALMRLAETSVDPFLQRAGLLNMLRREGQLLVYESERQFQADRSDFANMEAEGIALTYLKGAQIAEYQPGLSAIFTHGVYTHHYATIDDPRDYTVALAKKFVADGGILERAEVTALTSDGVMTDAGEKKGRVVIAAGAFSHRLARMAGVSIPLETERGYNTTLQASAFDLKQHITFGGHGFVVSRLRSGLRVGGAVELGGLDLPPNFARADAMLKKAARFLPGLETSGGVPWMGFRPSMPDSLPAIGALPGRPDVLCAFGHGHLGLTQSTATALLVADMLTGAPPPLDMTPFSPARFGRV